MSAQSMIAKLRKSLDEARAQGATDSDLVNQLVKIAKAAPGGVEMLREAYAESVRENRTDLSSAIEARLFPSAAPSLGEQVGKSVKKADTLEGAIGSALRNPTRNTSSRCAADAVFDGDTVLKTVGESPLAKARVRDADAQTADIKKRASKVRSDIHGGGGLGGSR